MSLNDVERSMIIVSLLDSKIRFVGITETYKFSKVDVEHGSFDMLEMFYKNFSSSILKYV